MGKLLTVLFYLFSFSAFSQSGPKTYEITLRVNKKDSVFYITAPAGDYTTKLWVDDPECTECKDCEVKKGDLKIPGAVQPYVKWKADLYLTGKDPYVEENTYYIPYYLEGEVVGVKYGYPVFRVDKWKRLPNK